MPIYNCEKYLAECLDSIVNQTKKELEIILIDDGSADTSGKICDDYAYRDDRIKVIHSENCGLVETRKKGVSVSKGKYIAYVDADDWIEPDMYEELYKAVTDGDCDMVAAGLYRQFDDRKQSVTNTIKPGMYDRDGIVRSIMPKMLFNGIYYQMGVRPNLVNKLFRRELIYQEQMDVPAGITNGEDTAVTYSCIMRAERIFLSDQIYYHYRQHSEAMTKTKSSAEDIDNLKVLYSHLKQKLCLDGYEDIMAPQINTYISNMLVQRCLEIYDRKGEIFSAFGGIEPDSRIAVYGAGNFGRQVCGYAAAKLADVVWVDEKYDFYQAQGMSVGSIDVLADENVDYVVIAIIDESVAGEVKNKLCHSGIASGKIRWLDLEYIASTEKLLSIGMV
ncbi:MAG: glycosyltransferase [Eubacterium sp.]|nr:glycosyltransferase [Eubacterium sp.]